MSLCLNLYHFILFIFDIYQNNVIYLLYQINDIYQNQLIMQTLLTITDLLEGSFFARITDKTNLNEFEFFVDETMFCGELEIVIEKEKAEFSSVDYYYNIVHQKFTLKSITDEAGDLVPFDQNDALYVQNWFNKKELEYEN